jgi:hypothetical protein
MNNKPTALTIATLGMTIVALLLFGCATSKNEPKIEPLPPEKLHELLHISDNYAYKSITHDDYIIKEECQGVF